MFPRMNPDLGCQRADNFDSGYVVTAGETAIAAGIPQLLPDGKVGIPAMEIPAGKKGVVRDTGYYYGRKVYNRAITAGDIVGWDANGDSNSGHTRDGQACTEGCVTNDPTAWDFPVGTAVESVAAGADDFLVAANVFRNGRLPGAVAVAADALVIPVTAGIVTKTTGADAEALTLVDGFVGQRLKIILGTDGGGDGTLTPASPCGFASIKFAAAGDQVELEFTSAGWIIIGANGAVINQ